MKTVLVACALSTVAALSGCATLGRWAKVTEFAAITTTTCDWAETHALSTNNWSTTIPGYARLEETNPILGDSPSTSSIDFYMGSALAGEALLGRVLPRWAQTLTFLAVTGFEIRSLTNNASWGVPVTCGFSGGSVRTDVARTMR